MKTEVEIWVDLKAEKTETGAKRKSSESFFAIWMTSHVYLVINKDLTKMYLK